MRDTLCLETFSGHQRRLSCETHYVSRHLVVISGGAPSSSCQLEPLLANFSRKVFFLSRYLPADPETEKLPRLQRGLQEPLGIIWVPN